MKENLLILEAKKILIELLDSISTLSHEEYTQKIGLLSNATIGEHTRHIIEPFQLLLMGYETAIIDYNKRKRNIEMQQNIDYAAECIAYVISVMEKENKFIRLHTEYDDNDTAIETNYYRELLYNIEHCIHHQAIIKIAFLFLGKTHLNENFGVAKSTIKNRAIWKV